MKLISMAVLSALYVWYLRQTRATLPSRYIGDPAADRMDNIFIHPMEGFTGCWVASGRIGGLIDRRFSGLNHSPMWLGNHTKRSESAQ
jgi:hypothetical protein